MGDPNRNHLWGRALLEELARAGVREVVVAPGSRSTPLVLAAAALPGIRMAVQPDERSAGFLALGVGKATGRPAAVITTSGTAVANLLPAVVEASQGEVPLLLLTADRPPELRGADANQAIDQVHLFGRYVRLFQETAPGRLTDRTLRHLRSLGSRAVAAAVGDPPGPVHLNLPFAKPLEPEVVPGDVPGSLSEDAPLAWRGRGDEAPWVRVHPRRWAPGREAVRDAARRLGESRRPLLVAGPVPRPWEVGPVLGAFASREGIPLLADPLSGSRYGAGDGPEVLGAYDLFLRSGSFRSAREPDLILRVGATPTSASLADFLEERAGVPQLVVDGGSRWKDHLAAAEAYVAADPLLFLEALGQALGAGAEGGREPIGDPGWLEEWRRAEEATVEVLVREGTEGAFFEGTILSEVADRCPEEALLFVSNSMPIRDLDAFVPPRGRPLRCFGNRGASGIDGIVSTAVGMALGSGRPVVAVVGDLALVHDMNGLLALRDAEAPVTFVVVHNDGGGIFHRLPIRSHEPEFTRFFATPHGLAMERVAALHGLSHLLVEGRAGAGAGTGAGEGGTEGGEALRGRDGLRAALERAAAMDGPVLLEVRTDRDENEGRHREVEARVRAALEG